VKIEKMIYKYYGEANLMKQNEFDREFIFDSLPIINYQNLSIAKKEEEQNDIINFKKIVLLRGNSNNITQYESKEDYIFKKYYEGHNKGYLFWIFGKTVFISVFGDSYMWAIISNSAISNFKGTIYGSSIAILIVVYLACYHYMIIGNHLSEAKMGVIISFIYFGLAAEIFYLNKYFNL